VKVYIEVYPLLAVGAYELTTLFFQMDALSKPPPAHPHKAKVSCRPQEPAVNVLDLLQLLHGYKREILEEVLCFLSVQAKGSCQELQALAVPVQGLNQPLHRLW
jgi:hypothetical protein